MPVIITLGESLNMSKTIEITVELAKHFLPGLEDRLTVLHTQKSELDNEIVELSNTIAEIKTKLNGELLPVTGNGDPRRRLRKGEGDRRVIDFMSNLPSAVTLTLAEVAKKAGVPVSTAYRTMKYRHKEKFVEEKGLWRKR